MTTETPTITRESLEAAIASAQEELTKSQTDASTKVAALMNTSPIDFIALGAASAPVETAQRKYDRAVSALGEFVNTSKWEQSSELRAPAVAAIRSLLIDTSVSSPLSGALGTIKVDDKGVVTVALRPTFRAVDFDAINTMIAAEVNGPELLAQGITSIDVTVKDADKSNALVDLKPTGSKGVSTAAPAGDGSKVGALEYEYNGAWLSSRQLLDALKADNHAFYTKRSKSTAWDGGNGMSNMAKDAAKDLTLPSRTKEAVA